jgi:hypothetical protein
MGAAPCRSDRAVRARDRTGHGHPLAGAGAVAMRAPHAQTRHEAGSVWVESRSAGTLLGGCVS